MLSLNLAQDGFSFGDNQILQAAALIRTENAVSIAKKSIIKYDKAAKIASATMSRN